MDPISSDFGVSSCLLLSADIHAQPSGVRALFLFWNNHCILEKPLGLRSRQRELDDCCIQYELRQSWTIQRQSQPHTHIKFVRQTKERSEEYNLELDETKQNWQRSKKWLQCVLSQGQGSLRLAAEFKQNPEIPSFFNTITWSPKLLVRSRKHSGSWNLHWSKNV